MVLSGLSVSSRSLWAKTGLESVGLGHLWEPLYVHMADAAEVARLLWRRWLPRATKHFCLETTGLKRDDMERLVAWLAGMHDIGKATPAFQSKNQNLAERVTLSGLSVPQHILSCKHAAASQVILQKWLVGQDWDVDLALTYSSIVGGHHGATPDESELDILESESAINPDDNLGGDDWLAVQLELAQYVSEECGFASIQNGIMDHPLSPAVQVILTGLVIVADWVASNTELFPLSGDESLSWSDSRQRAREAWDDLLLPEPLDLSEVPSDDDELFHARFAGLPKDAVLRPAQKAAVEAARSMEEPGLLIIEAPMGNGKTEASLLCAEILAEKFWDGGVAYLLPTMATSNAMFSRVHSWLEEVCSATGTSGQSLQLMHSKAELNQEYTDLRYKPSSMGDDSEESVIAHQWYSGRKRGLLAPFVVGTVDQLLMAALNAKHVHLRHLGLAGKVVIIDEVHAYDAYMNVYLDRALQFLGEYRAPVILLSATLPPDRREALIKAYRGLGKRASVAPAPRLPSGEPAYPLITSVSRDKSTEPDYVSCEQSGTSVSVSLEFLPDDDESLLTLLRESLVDGGCACVIRDTVGRAQQTYDLLSNELDAEIKLVHSRFIALDRARNDEELLRLLGPDSSERPASLVVVGTQVIEQSLDIDFDLMVTDIAPMDLLLQRMGRLHRHSRGEGQSQRPKPLRNAKCVITGALDWGEDLPVFDKGITRVYGLAVLWQTALVLRDRLANDAFGIMIPGAIAPLVEQTYEALQLEQCPLEGEHFDDFICALDKWKEEIISKQASAKNWLLPKISTKGLLNGWMRNRLNLNEESSARVAVRDTQESLEVVLVVGSDECVSLLQRLSEECGVSGYLGSDYEMPDNESARIAATCTVGLPRILALPFRFDQVIQHLEAQTPLSWSNSHWLKGFLALRVDADGKGSVECGGAVYDIVYTAEKGLEARERKEEANE